MAAAGLAVEGFGIFGSHKLQIVRKTLRLPRWEANGFRVVQISDVHINNPGAKAMAQEAVRLAIAEKPDLIAVTGDFLNEAMPWPRAGVLETFKMLEDASCPCLGVLGNHDYAFGQHNAVLQTLSETPLRILRNETVDLEGITIAGMDDALWGKFDPSVLDRGRSSKSTLAMLHEPDYVRDMPAWVSLVLSGHSHGGEVCLPGGSALHTPIGAKDYIAGFYGSAPVPLYVSRGVATLGPIRVYCPPDISVLTLESV